MRYLFWTCLVNKVLFSTSLISGPEAMSAPVFPQRLAASTGVNRADRRREIAGSVRSRTEGSKAEITITASHGVSLAEVSARLSAPTLSCDWVHYVTYCGTLD